MILLIGLYLDADANRFQEFMECVRRNAANPSIDSICIFFETPGDCNHLLSTYPPLNSQKVNLILLERRVTYKDLFSYANRQLAGQRIIIANADIFFDESLLRLDGYDVTQSLLCLSRWDVQPDGERRFFDYPLSQDAWIFDTPVREFPCAFHLGVPGCDNRLAWEAQKAGLAVRNPSRSIRACHLHLSGVRRYSERHRLAGPGSSIPATFLEHPWLWFVVPCMGRLDDVRRTINTVIGQPRSTYLLVDYACPDQAGAWVTEHYPRARVVACQARCSFKGAEARNRGADAVDDDGILCFLDADVTVAVEFSAHVLANFKTGSFLVPDGNSRGLSTALVCSKADFDRAGGFDEAFADWGEEVVDLRTSLRRLGLTERTFPASWISHPIEGHPQRASILPHCAATAEIHAAYRRAKNAALDETPDAAACFDQLSQILLAFRNVEAKESGIPCAAVAFRESMGYTLGRLEAGASSHNNDLRPFAYIPESLAGLAYTQVVAFSVSPIEVEFLAPGKLYVLVGTDWKGGQIAVAWLREAAQHELIPPLQTRCGTRFEVWSLVADAGYRVVLPTQVMLVAAHLERR
jgi:hypothetical protein